MDAGGVGLAELVGSGWTVREPSTATAEGAGLRLGRPWTGLLGSGSARACVGPVSETLPGRRLNEATAPTCQRCGG